MTKRPGAGHPRRVTQLIELGRDREAADLAVTDSIGGPMDVRSQLDELGPLLGGVVSRIAPEHLVRPTPCTSFDVQAVLAHMISGATAFAAAFRGVEAGPADTTNVLHAFGPALTTLAASIQAPGALERTVESPFGPLSGETFARFVVLDGLVHGWDLATATDQAYAPSDALVSEVEAFARDTLDPLRDGETFGPAVDPAPSATPIERLAAFTGRRRP